MLLRLFYDSSLAQASYLIGCNATREALVVDPNRDVEQYIRAADAEGLRITHVTETHIHADFISGSRELAQRTGARLYLSDEGGPDWRYAYAAEAQAVPLHDGDVIRIGNVRLDVMHTPGHTPEHLAFLVTDTAASDRPMGALTGDFLFVGDVGRPDLLERAANVLGTMETSARALFRSLGRLRDLPDYLQIWPGHGAGSACGKALGAVPQTTLGYERFVNWALQLRDEDAFVREILEGQPEPPRYFGEMKRINRDGPRMLSGLPRPPRLAPARATELLLQGALFIDTRAIDQFAAAHVPSVNIPLDRSFTTWAGWLVPYDRDFYVVVEPGCERCRDAVARDLRMIGLDRIAGYAVFDDELAAAWRAAGGTPMATPQMTVDDAAAALGRGDLHIVDVRWPSEWKAGHLPGVPNVPLGYLEERLHELPTAGTLVLHCQTGQRSSIAASLLHARGWSNVASLVGGFAAWQAAGYPITTATSPEPVNV